MNKINHLFQVNKIKNRGYTIIKNFLSPVEIDLIKKKILKIQKKKNVIKTKKNIWHIHNHDKLFIKIILKPDIKKILIPLLNDPFYKVIPDNLPNYILGESLLINDSSFLHLHIDSLIPSSSKRTFMVQVIFLLDDRTKDNGCSVIVKNTHRSDKFADRNNKNYTFLEGKRGDLIIWDSRLWHGRSEGRSEFQSSQALCYTMQSWFLKQRFDYVSLLPKRMYLNLNNMEKQLLGFCSLPPSRKEEGMHIRKGYKILKYYK